VGSRLISKRQSFDKPVHGDGKKYESENMDALQACYIDITYH